jgi:hypothetical protein
METIVRVAIDLWNFAKEKVNQVKIPVKTRTLSFKANSRALGLVKITNHGKFPHLKRLITLFLYGELCSSMERRQISHLIDVKINEQDDGLWAITDISISLCRAKWGPIYSFGTWLFTVRSQNYNKTWNTRIEKINSSPLIKKKVWKWGYEYRKKKFYRTHRTSI